MSQKCFRPNSSPIEVHSTTRSNLKTQAGHIPLLEASRFGLKPFLPTMGQSWKIFLSRLFQTPYRPTMGLNVLLTSGRLMTYFVSPISYQQFFPSPFLVKLSPDLSIKTRLCAD